MRTLKHALRELKPFLPGSLVAAAIVLVPLLAQVLASLSVSF